MTVLLWYVVGWRTLLKTPSMWNKHEAVPIRNKSGFVIGFWNTFTEQALSLFTNFSFAIDLTVTGNHFAKFRFVSQTTVSRISFVLMHNITIYNTQLVFEIHVEKVKPSLQWCLVESMRVHLREVNSISSQSYKVELINADSIVVNSVINHKLLHLFHRSVLKRSWLVLWGISKKCLRFV